MSKQKLEFFRFVLENKSRDKKTFREFMLDNDKCNKDDSPMQIFVKLYKYFMDELTGDFAKNDSLKKVMTIICNTKKNKINKHYDERPQPKYPDCIISGVVNGGRYGKDRIVSNIDDKDKLGELLPKQPVLQYYYIFLYLPLDHHEGFLMIHSDGKEETITNIARDYVGRLFKYGDYIKPIFNVYAPKSFQEDFKKNAIIKSIKFKTTYIDDCIEKGGDPICSDMKDYDVIVSVRPKGESAGKFIDSLESIKKYWGDKFFGTLNDNKKLKDFESCKVETTNIEDKSSKTFDWNFIDNDFAPVVYIDDKVVMEEDGTPNFKSLDEYCKSLFKDKILKELRPDLYVGRMV